MKTVVMLLMTAAMIILPKPVVAADSETINPQVVKQKEVDDGGSGRYRAIVVSEKTLPHFTVYRPRNIKYRYRDYRSIVVATSTFYSAFYSLFD